MFIHSDEKSILAEEGSSSQPRSSDLQEKRKVSNDLVQVSCIRRQVTKSGSPLFVIILRPETMNMSKCAADCDQEK
jgi:hypothetical protein